MRCQPIGMGLGQQGEVVQFGLEFRRPIRTVRKFIEPCDGQPVILQFTQQRAELLRKARTPRAGAETFQFARALKEQRPQHHHAPFLVKKIRWGHAELIEDKPRQPLEGKDLQPRVAAQRFRPSETYPVGIRLRQRQRHLPLLPTQDGGASRREEALSSLNRPSRRSPPRVPAIPIYVPGSARSMRWARY